jgi:hypothetical protein
VVPVACHRREENVSGDDKQDMLVYLYCCQCLYTSMLFIQLEHSYSVAIYKVTARQNVSSRSSIILTDLGDGVDGHGDLVEPGVPRCLADAIDPKMRPI